MRNDDLRWLRRAHPRRRWRIAVDAARTENVSSDFCDLRLRAAVDAKALVASHVFRFDEKCEE